MVWGLGLQAWHFQKPASFLVPETRRAMLGIRVPNNDQQILFVPLHDNGSCIGAWTVGRQINIDRYMHTGARLTHDLCNEVASAQFRCHGGTQQTHPHPSWAALSVRSLIYSTSCKGFQGNSKLSIVQQGPPHESGVKHTQSTALCKPTLDRSQARTAHQGSG